MSVTPAVITGVGPVSAIGCGRNTFWDALLDGQHGFGPVTLCDISKSPSKIAAEVKDFDLEAYVVKGGVMARHTPRAVRPRGLRRRCSRCTTAEIDLDACDPDRLGVFVGTSVGNLGEVFEIQRKFESTGKQPAACRSTSAACLQHPRADSDGHIGLQLRARCARAIACA